MDDSQKLCPAKCVKEVAEPTCIQDSRFMEALEMAKALRTELYTLKRLMADRSYELTGSSLSQAEDSVEEEPCGYIGEVLYVQCINRELVSDIQNLLQLI